MHGLIIATLLLLVLLHQHIQFRLLRKIADKLGLPSSGHLDLLMDPKVAPPEPAPPAATTSAFSSGPADFMAHARQMEARTATPAAKAEVLMMNNDHAQRKLRAALVRGG